MLRTLTVGHYYWERRTSEGGPVKTTTARTEPTKHHFAAIAGYSHSRRHELESKRSMTVLRMTIAFAFLLSCAIGYQYWTQLSSLTAARQNLGAGQYEKAVEKLNTVNLPLLTAQANDLRARIRRAKAHDQAVAESARLTEILSKVSDDFQAANKSFSIIKGDDARGSEAGNKRHDDAISANPDVRYDLEQAKLEVDAAESVSSESKVLMSKAADARDQLYNALAPTSSFTVLDQAIARATSEYQDYSSNWSAAERPMVDTMTERINGNIYARNDSAQLQRFYEQSEEASHKASVDIDIVIHEEQELQKGLLHKLDSVKTRSS